MMIYLNPRVMADELFRVQGKEHARRIAEKYAADFFVGNKGDKSPNPHKNYWKAVCANLRHLEGQVKS